MENQREVSNAGIILSESNNLGNPEDKKQREGLSFLSAWVKGRVVDKYRG